ncbi:hypothetical protein [Roseivirga pacifica]|uniref:hypothetical protein n=1 Tax=Roseivirga pacifica TaxID=1267423 RepID=UPI00227AC73B|nr:hypothetical protein [Roseivirga pacifica]
MLKKILPLFLFPLLFASCSNNPKEQVQTKASEFYKLAIVDSVRIDILASGHLPVVDVHDETGNLLTVDSENNTVRIISPNGEVLEEKVLIPSSPEGLGSPVLSGEFFGDDVALSGMYYIKIYNSDLEVQKSMRNYNNKPLMMFMGFNHLFETGKKLVAYMGPHTKQSKITPEYYQEFTIADLVDPSLKSPEEKRNDDIFKPIGKLDSVGRYMNGMSYLYIISHLDVKSGIMYYTHSNDTTLYQFDIEKNSLVSKTAIPFDKFLLSKGLPQSPAAYEQARQSPGDSPGSISRYYRAGEFDVLVYKSGLELSKIEELGRDTPDFRTRMNKANPWKTLIAKDGKRVNRSLTKNPKISTIHMADNKGFLWASKNINDLEEEPDFVTIYKMKIVLDDE